MKSVLFALLSSFLLTSYAAQAGSFSFTPGLQGVPGTSYVTAGQAIHFVDPAFGIDENIIQSNQGISVDQFASTSDLNTTIANINASFGTSISGLQSQFTALRSQAYSGAALAAALTPMLPADGKSNHLNFAAATAFDREAWSINYAHVEGAFDFIAGAAFTEKNGLAKVGVGFSW